MDIGGQVRGIGAAVLVGLVLALVGAFTRWRSRDRLRGETEVPPDVAARFLTRLGIAVGLVLVGLLAVSIYYGNSGYVGLRSVRAGGALWVATAGVWVVALWQLLRGRLAPYPGGWTGLTSCAMFWIFPVGPILVASLSTLFGRLVDWDHVPGKGLLAMALLGLLYVAVPVAAFRAQNRRRRQRSEPHPQVTAPSAASS
jgi:hypothetical protein